MRSSEFGVIPNLVKNLHKDILLTVFSRICLSRYFDLGVVEAVKEKLVTFPVYLSLGQEATSAAMSVVIPEFMIFAQHRCHATYLAFGGNPEKLRDELLGLPTGTSGGRAGSNCIQCHENSVTMWGHHGLIGENVPLGVGAALGSAKPVVCFFGDGAAEEDYVFSAMGFAATHRLPVLFICEDNNLSILTPVSVRRTWSLTEVVKALGMVGVDIADDPWTIYVKTQELQKNLPAFINIYTCRTNWHVGVGYDGPPEWDRFELVKKDLERGGFAQEAQRIEEEVRRSMQKLWDKKQLQTLLGK